MRRFPERPVPYPTVLELTDKGPGAGVHNIEVQDLFLLVCQLLESDHRIRLHRAPHDSAQNEAERTNAAIGEALTTGSPVAPPNDPFHGLPTIEDCCIGVPLYISHIESSSLQTLRLNNQPCQLR